MGNIVSEDGHGGGLARKRAPYREIIGIILAVALALSMVWLPTAATGEAHAAVPAAKAGKASDGVDFSAKTGLLSKKAYIYYGAYKHVTGVGDDGLGGYAVTGREASATPILWRVAGEEQNAKGKGDGYLSVISQNVLDVKRFRDADAQLEARIAKDPLSDTILSLPQGKSVSAPAHSESKSYAGSAVQAFLGGDFLKSFSSVENAAIPKVDVTTNTYKLGQKGADGKEALIPFTNHAPRFYSNTDTVFTYAGSEAKKQKVWLPWFTSTDDALNYADPDQFSGDYEESLYYSADGAVAADDAVNKNNAIYRRVPGGATEPAKLKGGADLLTWNTRSPCPGYHAYGNLAVFGADGYDSADSQAVVGVKPVTKLRLDGIVFASEITAKKAVGKTKAGKGYAAAAKAVGDSAAKAYKLTVLGRDGKVKLTKLALGKKTLKGTSGKEKITIGRGKSLTFKGKTKGADRLAYKIVGKAASARRIVAYGTGTKTSLKVTAKKNYNVAKASNLKKGAYTLYIWAQDDQAVHSNVASKVKVFKLAVK